MKQLIQQVPLLLLLLLLVNIRQSVRKILFE
jgi:hypothetical protein